MSLQRWFCVDRKKHQEQGQRFHTWYVIGVPSASTVSPSIIPILKKASRVAIYPDKDEAGGGFVTKIKKALEGTDVRVHRQPLPLTGLNYTDINSCLEALLNPCPF